MAAIESDVKSAVLVPKIVYCPWLGKFSKPKIESRVLLPLPEVPVIAM